MRGDRSKFAFSAREQAARSVSLHQKTPKLIQVDHVMFLAADPKARARQLCIKHAFHYAGRSESGPARYVVRRALMTFVFRGIESAEDERRLQQSGDSVVDVALEVNSLEMVLAQLRTARVLGDRKISTDFYGTFKSAVVSSPWEGVVQHTIVDRSAYRGPLMPGYITDPPTRADGSVDDFLPFSDLRWDQEDPMTTCIDHITFACEVDTMPSVQEFYRQNLFFRRFMFRDDEPDGGMTVYTKRSGLRLMAVEYWDDDEIVMKSESIKFTLVEPIPLGRKDDAANQVRMFLDNHGGPGVQHIAMHTPNITRAIRVLKARGVRFVEPPDTYYSEVGKGDDIRLCGEDVDDLRSCGVLLDTDEEPQQSTSNVSSPSGSGKTIPTLSNLNSTNNSNGK